MRDIIPVNLEPIQDIINRVRHLRNPGYKNKDCQQIESRFWDQDWKTQLDIYELWLDIDNDYSRTCLYRVLDRNYWELLQELVDRGVTRAEALSERIMEYSIKHIRTQIIAFFVTEYAPIEIVRKNKKQLARSLDVAYNALALRIGGDKDFNIDKDRLLNRLEYFDICAKFNIPTNDEEAIDELKLYFKYYGPNLWCDNIDEDNTIREIQFSLRFNSAIDNWRKAIDTLGLARAASAFDRWNADLQCRINRIYEADSQFRRFPDINHDRLAYYWSIFIDMANADLSDIMPAEYVSNLMANNPTIRSLMDSLNLKVAAPLDL